MTKHDEGVAKLLKHSDFQAYNEFLNELREKDKELLAVKIVEKKIENIVDKPIVG